MRDLACFLSGYRYKSHLDSNSNVIMCAYVFSLSERHRLIAEGRIPPVTYEFERELWAKRERFGQYGLASGVSPAELWPTVEVRRIRLPFRLLSYYFVFKRVFKL